MLGLLIALFFESMHGPENAEFELKKAYNCVIEAAVTHFWDRRSVPGVNPDEAVTLYRQAYDLFKQGDRLTAERLARAAKHLARALWHEAKIAYLTPRTSELPFLENAREEFNLHEDPGTTAELLCSVEQQIPKGMAELPADMRRYLGRGNRHLKQMVTSPAKSHELLSAEHLKAAYEYGRVAECLSLVHESTPVAA